MIQGKTTKEAAGQLGITQSLLLTTVSRHPELRPAIKYGNAYIWTDEEIERFSNRGKSKGGRPKKTI